MTGELPANNRPAFTKEFIQRKSKGVVGQWVTWYRHPVPAGGVKQPFLHRHVHVACQTVVQSSIARTGSPDNGLQVLQSTGWWARNVVYVWVHLGHRQARKYVGKTERTLQERSVDHIGSAYDLQQAMFVNVRVKEKELKAVRLYREWARYGVTDFVVIPVAVVTVTPVVVPYAPTAAEAAALKRALSVHEQQWMDAFCSLAPMGYNQRRAVAVQNMPPPQHFIVLGRYYGYYDMQRRLQVIHDASLLVPPQNTAPVLQLASDDSVLDYFKGYALGTLQRLHTYLVDIIGGVYPAPVPAADVPLLLQAVRVAVGARMRRRHKNGCRISISYSSSLWDCLNFTAAFDACAHILPVDGLAPMVSSHPLLTYSYGQPQGSVWLSTPGVVRQPQPADVGGLCTCSHPRWDRFKPAGHTHVCTTDAVVVAELFKDVHGIPDEELEDLLFLWRQGYGYRLPDQGGPALTHEQKEGLVAEVAHVLHSYRGRVVASQGQQVSGVIQQWCDAIQAVLEQQISALQVGRPIQEVIPRRTAVPAPRISMARFRRWVRLFQNNFVVTRCDKAGSTFAAMCPALYVSQLREQMNTACYQVCAQPPGDVVGLAHFALAPEFEHLNGSTELARPDLLVKFHKQPVKFRTLCCCHSYYHKPLGHTITSALRALQPGVEDVWSRTVRSSGLTRVPGPMRPWMINSSAQAVQQVQQVSAAGLSWTEFLEEGGVASFDFAQMYTMVPLEDLMSRLSTWLLRPIWESHYTGNIPFAEALQSAHESLPVLKVYREKTGGKPRWFANWQTANAHLGAASVSWFGAYGHDHGGEFELLNVLELEWLLRQMLQHNYVECFGVVYRQSLGIPMGVSPGVFLANYYLCTYELAHIKELGEVLARHPVPAHITDPLAWGWAVAHDPQAVHQHRDTRYDGCLALFVWHSWQYVLRFVDDLQVIGHAFVRDMLYVNQAFAGSEIHGVYPTHLDLQEQQNVDPYRVPYLDILQLFSNVAGRLVVRTTLHDRRRMPEFRHVHIAQYTHATSAVSERTLRGIVISQTRRLLSLISHHHFQVIELGLLADKLLQRGYAGALVYGSMRRCFDRFSFYLHNTPYRVLCEVQAEVAHRQGLRLRGLL